MTVNVGRDRVAVGVMDGVSVAVGICVSVGVKVRVGLGVKVNVGVTVEASVEVQPGRLVEGAEMVLVGDEPGKAPHPDKITMLNNPSNARNFMMCLLL